VDKKIVGVLDEDNELIELKESDVND